MVMPAAPDERPNSEGIWDFMRLDRARRLGVLIAFGAAYSLLMILGLVLRESSQQLTIIWPAAGLLFMALWFSPRRSWVWILGVQVAVELSIDLLRTEHFVWQWYLPFIVANSLDAVVSALIAQRWMPSPHIPRVRTVLLFIAAVALGAAASAVVGAYGSAQPIGGGHYMREWQLWWAGNWLGSLCVAPVIMGWTIRWRARKLTVAPPPTAEIALVGCGLLGMTIWVFSAAPGRVTTIVDLPYILLALVIVAAFRLPPRWCTSFAAGSALIASYYASRGLGPFAGDPSPFVRVGAVQLYLATLVVINFMLSIVLLEMRNALQQLRASGERYQNFVEQSSEAVWRIELDQPMSAGLEVKEQIAWLREHAYVAECNLVYLQLNRLFGLPDADSRLWRADVPWSAIYLEHIGTAAQQGYSTDGLQFTLSKGSRHLTCTSRDSEASSKTASWARVWCVARDISALPSNSTVRLAVRKL